MHQHQRQHQVLRIADPALLMPLFPFVSQEDSSHTNTCHPGTMRRESTVQEELGRTKRRLVALGLIQHSMREM